MNARAWVLIPVVCSALGTACRKGGHPEAPVTEWPLGGGGTVADLFGASETVVLLVYQPSDCFACGNPIGFWLDERRPKVDRRALLVLTRQPTGMEVHAMTVARIAGVPWLRDPNVSRTTPRGYVIANGRAIDSAIGQGAIERLFELSTGPSKTVPSQR